MRKTWTGRMLMEDKVSESSWFLTLTYNPESLPYDPEFHNPTLNRKDVQLYLARLRAIRGGGLKFRYFISGEYGDESLRPHYHAILFFPHSSPAPANLEETLLRYWGKGNIDLRESNPARFAYTASYCVKKYRADERGILGPGMTPEFSLVSRMPALGTGYIEQLADNYLSSNQLQDELERSEDVAKVFRIQGNIYPIPAVLRNKLRTRLGVPLLRKERQAHHESYEEDIEANWVDPPTEDQIKRARNYVRRIDRGLKRKRPRAIL